MSQLDFDLGGEFSEDDIKLLVVYSDALNPVPWVVRQFNSELTESFLVTDHRRC